MQIGVSFIINSACNWCTGVCGVGWAFVPSSPILSKKMLSPKKLTIPFTNLSLNGLSTRAVIVFPLNAVSA